MWQYTVVSPVHGEGVTSDTTATDCKMIETMEQPVQLRARTRTGGIRLLQNWKLWVTFAFLVVAAAIALYFATILLSNNFHTVVPGKVYRGAQPSLDEWNALAEKYGIRTVINLRGDNPWLGWHKLQDARLKKLGVNFESLNFSAERLPFASEVRRLVRIYDRAEYPIFLHCHRGIDRTGFASTIYLLLKTDTPLSEARRQLSWHFGHMPFGKPNRLNILFDDYEAWLAAKRERHSNARFRHWVENEYRANWSCEPLQIVGPQPKIVDVDEPTTFRIRTRNTGKKTWPLRPTRTAGVHLWYHLANRDIYFIIKGRAGLLRKDVASGEVVEFTVVVPPIRRPGRYVFRADLIDEDEGHFYVIGSPLLELEIEARENVVANRD